MSGFEPSDSIRKDLFAEAQRKLALAESRMAVIETVRETARGICKSDGITFILRDGEMCHYVEEDAIGPLWKGQRFALSACISGWTMLNGQTAVIEDVLQDPRIPYDAYLPTFVKSLIMTPVGEGRVAAMGAYWKDRRRFSDLEIMTVKTYSAVVGKALSDILSRE
jgi:GAF domain-containing protein